MNSTKRIAAIGSIFALALMSGCAGFDTTVALDGNGYDASSEYAASDASGGSDILKQMQADSQGGE